MYKYILYCVSFISYAHDVMSYVWSCNYHSVRKTRDEKRHGNAARHGF